MLQIKEPGEPAEGMDDAQKEDEGYFGWDNFWVTLISLWHIIVIALFIKWLRNYCCGCCKCCKRAQAKQEEQQPDSQAKAGASEDQLQPKKSVLTCYLLWLVAGPLGAHHFYLGRLVHGITAAWSFNFMLFGWCADAFLIPFYVRGFNKQLAHDQAPYDGSSRTVCIKLPLALICICATFAGFVFYGPALLQLTGAVDLDRIAAGTKANPYETLGIARGASLADAKSAYRKASLKWHPDRNLGCGHECESKMSEITKAFDMIKKRLGSTSDATSWKEGFKGVGKDWLAVLEVLAQK